jgi:hypothetical protein
MCREWKKIEPPPPQIGLYVNLETIRLRGRPRNRLQGEVREDVRLVGGEGWQERKNFLRMVRPYRILNMPMY